MDNEPICYITANFFDWGVFKPSGGAIFVVTALLYIACLIASVWMILRIGRRIGWPKVTLAVGLVGLVPMVDKASFSLLLQMTSSHDQESTHIPAVITIGVSFGVVLAAWLAVELWFLLTKRRGGRFGAADARR